MSLLEGKGGTGPFSPINPSILGTGCDLMWLLLTNSRRILVSLGYPLVLDVHWIVLDISTFSNKFQLSSHYFKVRRSAGPLLTVVLLRVYEPIPPPEVVVTAL